MIKRTKYYGLKAHRQCFLESDYTCFVYLNKKMTASNQELQDTPLDTNQKIIFPFILALLHHAHWEG